ncbi:uncharacterized protein N7459_004251 [Penicillium hispanicum]|uniref:uncharacterized protein n=1 Tax=Penicillium hispanicum TaxID=1080232 RepID=UPI00254217BB|nr:uncharacterized protein N7459_004251 [Penicillium hispanicum]KAJ5584451.1 hypothetical protein N7459_004251 [Penicillium hispanicum]
MASTLSRLHERLVVKSVDRDGLQRPVGMLDNHSIRPTPAKDRSWTQLTYLVFWFSATANVSNLYSASTGMAMGLTMWEAIACSLGGQFLAGCLMALNGRGGAIVFLHAIFPSIANIPDKMGSKSALTSAQMMCFLIYWLFNCAFLVVPVPKMKSLVYIKVFVFFGATLAMLAWTISLAGGTSQFLHAPSTVHGSQKRFLILKFFFLGLASCGTFISNAADLQRYARKPNDVLIGQIISFPVSNFLVAVLGNIIASASKSIFGELIWNPITFLDKLMEGERYTHGNRTACAFISLAFVYSTIFSAIFENSIPAGNDIAALLPRYITIKRGFFICAIFSYAICPWYLLSTAAIFITFLSSYQIFLSAIAGILICDYYLIRRGYFNIPSLYTANPEGLYRYFHGFNPRAFVAYIVAVAPNFYGFLHQMGVKAPLGIQRFYYVAYPTGLVVAFGVYYLCCLASAPTGMEKSSGWREPQDYLDEHDPAVDESVAVEGVAVHTSVAEKGAVTTFSKETSDKDTCRIYAVS